MQQNLIDAARAVGTKPVTGRYFLCLCSKCGWLGSSEECRLVEDPIFGDGEYFCAVCGASEPDEVDAAEAFNAMLAGTASRHPDDVAVDRFALAMKAKLADARTKGRTGWDDPARCSVEFLAQLLVGHIGKDNAGNFEDVANLAMMLHQRGADPSVLADAAREKPSPEPVAHVKRWTNSSVIDSTGCKTCWEDLPDGTQLYTRQQSAPAVPDGLLAAARDFYNRTVADKEVVIRCNSAEKRDAVTAAGERLRALLAAAPQPVQAAGPIDRAIYDSIAANYHQQPAPAVTKVELDVIANLIELARVVTLAMDDSEERCGDDGRVHLIDSDNFDVVCGALDKLGELPDDKPGYTLGPAGKAEWALRGLLFAAPQPAQQLSSAIEEIAVERRRQIEVEGWTPEHDDQHRDYALAGAAGCYAMHALAFPAGDPPQPWPWDKAWWKPSPDKRRNWIKAAALLVAEIERADRMAAPQLKEGGE